MNCPNFRRINWTRCYLLIDTKAFVNSMEVGKLIFTLGKSWTFCESVLFMYVEQKKTNSLFPLYIISARPITAAEIAHNVWPLLSPISAPNDRPTDSWFPVHTVLNRTINTISFPSSLNSWQFVRCRRRFSTYFLRENTVFGPNSAKGPRIAISFGMGSWWTEWRKTLIKNRKYFLFLFACEN